MIFFIVVKILEQITDFYQKLHQPREAHKGHCKDADSNKSDRNTFESLWYVIESQVLTKSCEEDHCKPVTYSRGKGIDCSLSQIKHMGRKAEGEFLSNYGDSDTKDCTVCGNQWKINSQCLVQCRTGFLEHNLHHLNEGG